MYKVVVEGFVKSFYTGENQETAQRVYRAQCELSFGNKDSLSPGAKVQLLHNDVCIREQNCAFDEVYNLAHTD